MHPLRRRPARPLDVGRRDAELPPDEPGPGAAQPAARDRRGLRRGTVSKAILVSSDGGEVVPEVGPGTSLMRAAVVQGVAGILGDCGGTLGCATCHVFIDPGYLPLLPPPSCPCRQSALSSTCKKTSGSSSATTGSPTACSTAPKPSSTIAATLGENSRISPGRSCPSDCATGPTGTDHRVLVLDFGADLQFLTDIARR